MNDPLKKWRYEAIGKSITETLKEKEFDAHYVDNLEEATQMVLDMVPDFVNKFTDGKFFSSKDDDEIISEAKEEKE